HLLSLINDILDLSKVEAGKLELQLSDVDLRMLLENSLIMVKEQAMKHQIRISIDIEEVPETIEVDVRKFKQIMYNLLSNAVKFTPDGGKICISSQIVERNIRSGLRLGDSKDLQIIDPQIDENNVAMAKRKMCIEFSVSDTGIGIRSEDLKRILEPFEQVESSTSRKYQGTGLGLALTKKLVELHGGIFEAMSQGEGKGSTFTVVLPVLGI
ncbi:MAG: hypothetical protein GY801_28745, partial [bacterium]|nr:hypothetical protein [bacterium]